jgi:hypothetical protein
VFEHVQNFLIIVLPQKVTPTAKEQALFLNSLAAKSRDPQCSDTLALYKYFVKSQQLLSTRKFLFLHVSLPHMYFKQVLAFA